jgi:hypothetical protein
LILRASKENEAIDDKTFEAMRKSSQEAAAKSMKMEQDIARLNKDYF